MTDRRTEPPVRRGPSRLPARLGGPDVLAGLLFCLLGLGFGLEALSYRFGSPARMGSGFFPVVVAVTLFAMGAVIAIQGLRGGAGPEDRVQWGRLAPLLLILGAIGLIPAMPQTIFLPAAGLAFWLWRSLRERMPSLSVQSVHNVLADLTAAGLLRRIEPAGSPARYERRRGDNHHHIVCTSCGAIADVDCVVGHAPCMEPSDTAGYSLQSAEVTFWGLCAECQAQPA